MSKSKKQRPQGWYGPYDGTVELLTIGGYLLIPRSDTFLSMNIIKRFLFAALLIPTIASATITIHGANSPEVRVDNSLAGIGVSPTPCIIDRLNLPDADVDVSSGTDGCSVVAVLVPTTADIVFSLVNADGFSTLSGTVHSLTVTGVNSNITVFTNVTDALTIDQTNEDLIVTSTAASIKITAVNSDVTIDSLSTDKFTGNFTNTPTVMRKSVLRSGSITVLNDSLTINKVVSAVNYKLTNSKFTAAGLKIVQGTSRSLKTLNTDNKLRQVSCVPSSALYNTKGFPTTVRAVTVRSINRITGQIILSRKVKVNGVNRLRPCAKIPVTIRNGSLSASS